MQASSTLGTRIHTLNKLIPIFIYIDNKLSINPDTLHAYQPAFDQNLETVKILKPKDSEGNEIRDEKLSLIAAYLTFKQAVAKQENEDFNGFTEAGCQAALTCIAAKRVRPEEEPGLQRKMTELVQNSVDPQYEIDIEINKLIETHKSTAWLYIWECVALFDLPKKKDENLLRIKDSLNMAFFLNRSGIHPSEKFDKAYMPLKRNLFLHQAMLQESLLLHQLYISRLSTEDQLKENERYVEYVEKFVSYFKKNDKAREVYLKIINAVKEFMHTSIQVNLGSEVKSGDEKNSQNLAALSQAMFSTVSHLTPKKPTEKQPLQNKRLSEIVSRIKRIRARIAEIDLTRLDSQEEDELNIIAIDFANNAETYDAFDGILHALRDDNFEAAKLSASLTKFAEIEDALIQLRGNLDKRITDELCKEVKSGKSKKESRVPLTGSKKNNVFIYKDGELVLNEAIFTYRQAQYDLALKKVEPLCPDYTQSMREMIAGCISCFSGGDEPVTRIVCEVIKRNIETKRMPEAKELELDKSIQMLEEKPWSESLTAIEKLLTENSNEYENSVRLKMRACDNYFLHTGNKLELIKEALKSSKHFIDLGVEVSPRAHRDYFRVERNYLLYSGRIEKAYQAHLKYLELLQFSERAKANRIFLSVLKNLEEYYHSRDKGLLASICNKYIIMLSGSSAPKLEAGESKSETCTVERCFLQYAGKTFEALYQAQRLRNEINGKKQSENYDTILSLIIYPQVWFERLDSWRMDIDTQLQKLSYMTGHALEKKRDKLRARFDQVVIQHKAFARKYFNVEEEFSESGKEAILQNYKAVEDLINSLRTEYSDAIAAELSLEDNKGKKDKKPGKNKPNKSVTPPADNAASLPEDESKGHDKAVSNKIVSNSSPPSSIPFYDDGMDSLRLSVAKEEIERLKIALAIQQSETAEAKQALEKDLTAKLNAAKAEFKLEEDKTKKLAAELKTEKDNAAKLLIDLNSEKNKSTNLSKDLKKLNDKVLRIESELSSGNDKIQGKVLSVEIELKAEKDKVMSLTEQLQNAQINASDLAKKLEMANRSNENYADLVAAEKTKYSILQSQLNSALPTNSNAEAELMMAYQTNSYLLSLAQTHGLLPIMGVNPDQQLPVNGAAGFWGGMFNPQSQSGNAGMNANSNASAYQLPEVKRDERRGKGKGSAKKY